jgi:Rrf2 family protein
MKFSSQEEYGLRCLLQIARLGTEGSLTIPEISRIEGLSQTHVAKLLMILRKEGIITSTRGQSGGYSIARKPSEISVKEVLEALGGRLYDAEFCERHTGQLDVCKHSVDCGLKSLWQVIQVAVDDVVGSISLADLIAESQPGPNVSFFAAPARPTVPIR